MTSIGKTVIKEQNSNKNSNKYMRKHNKKTELSAVIKNDTQALWYL